MAESNLNALLEAGKGMTKPKSMVGAGMAKGRTDKGMVSGNAMKAPAVTKVEDYMGYAFDAAVRRGTDAARLALKAKMRQDGRSEAVQLAELKKFDDTIAKQQSLKKDAGLGEGYKEVYREAAGVGNQPSREEAERLVKSRQNLTNAGRTVRSVGNAINKTIVGPKPLKMGTDRYYGEGGI